MSQIDPVAEPLEAPLSDAEERRLAEAEADIAAGRVISHAAVRRWMLSWGTADELPRPQCGE